MIQEQRRRMFLLSLLFVLAAGPALGQESAGRTLSPYFLIRGREASAEALPLESTQVAVNVNGVIADVVVRQTYANKGTEPINAQYVFPGSTRASVHGMKITIHGQVVVARIMERQEARHEFEQARAQGKSASLLEQQRPNVFSMSVANILPEDRVEVELHYTELLIPTEGIYQFVYPAVVGPRYSNQPETTAPETDRWVKTPYLGEEEEALEKFEIGVTLSTGLPLHEVKSSSHAVNVSWEGRAVARVVLADLSQFGGNRDFVLSYRLRGREIQSGLMLYEGEEENFFLLMVQPPEQVRAADIPPREYIFILDVSGSMEGFPLDTAKALIKDLIGHLRETDLFNVVLFAGGSRVMASSSLPAIEGNVWQAIRTIEEERGGGGTEIVPALETSLALPRDEEFSRTVVIITDGYIAAEREVFEVIQKNLHRTNVFCFGIGSSVNRYLVEGIARAGVGEPFVVTKPAEAARMAEQFRRYVETPVLTDLQVSYGVFDAYDVEPPVLPDLFANRPIVMFGKYRGDPAGEIQVAGNGGGGEYARTFQVSETTPLEENRALRYLWARTKVARLSDFNLMQEDADVVGEVTSLGLSYSLLTRHTSFVAVLEAVRNLDGTARDVQQPLPLPRGVSVLAVGGGYAAGPEPELWILLAIAGLLTALIVLRRQKELASKR